MLHIYIAKVIYYHSEHTKESGECTYGPLDSNFVGNISKVAFIYIIGTQELDYFPIEWWICS